MTISLEAFSAAVLPTSLVQTTIRAQFTASVLMILLFSLHCLVPHFNESDGLEKCWRPAYRGTDVNRMSN